MRNPLIQWTETGRVFIRSLWLTHGQPRYQVLSMREQRIVWFAALILPLMILMFGIILPLEDKKISLQKSTQALQRQLNIVQGLAERVKSQQGNANLQHGNLLGNVEKLARQSHVRQAMTHIRPRPVLDGHQRLQVQLKGARYSDVLVFLDLLAKQGLVIESANLQKNSDKLDGLVQLQLTVMES